jgi:hypothetical protein
MIQRGFRPSKKATCTEGLTAQGPALPTARERLPRKLEGGTKPAPQARARAARQRKNLPGAVGGVPAPDLTRVQAAPKPAEVAKRQDLSGPGAQRLYEVSRDHYAPVLAAFATEWLDELARQPDGVAICLGRDGLAPFLAARTLLRIYPRRFCDVHPRRVQLAYLSRPLVRGAVADFEQAALLDKYLRARGVAQGKPLTLVDVGIHGSIQDCLGRIYPRRAVSGRYLVLRRRSEDPNGAFKRGFLADLDVAPRCPLEIGPSWPPLPGWELGGTLRHGDPLFLRPRSVHVLEDLWNGVGEAAAGFQVLAGGERVRVVRGRVEQVLALLPGPTIAPMQRIAIKRAALRGVVDGVARGQPEGGPGDVSEATHGLAAWLGELGNPASVDAHILSALVRRSRHAPAEDDIDTEADIQ